MGYPQNSNNFSVEVLTYQTRKWEDFFQLAFDIRSRGILNSESFNERILEINIYNQTVNQSFVILPQKQLELDKIEKTLADNHHLLKPSINRPAPIKSKEIENQQEESVDEEEEEIILQICILAQSKSRIEEISRLINYFMEDSKSKSKMMKENTKQISHSEFATDIRLNCDPEIRQIFSIKNFMIGIMNEEGTSMSQASNSIFYKFWDLEDISSQFQGGVYGVELSHHVNIQNEIEAFLDFTFKVESFYHLYRVQLSPQRVSLLTPDNLQKGEANRSSPYYSLLFKLDSYPIVYSKIRFHQQYLNYDLVKWKRCQQSNFLTENIMKWSNLIKMQIMKEMEILVEISEEELKNSPKNLSSLFAAFGENRVQAQPQNPIRILPFYESPLQKVRTFLANNKSPFPEIIYQEIGSLVLDNILTLNDFEMHKFLEQASIKIRQSSPDWWFKNLENNQNLSPNQKNRIKLNQNPVIHQNFCLLPKIIITPSVILFGDKERLRVSELFPRNEFYSKWAIVYLRDDNLQEFNFENSPELHNYFQSQFTKYIEGGVKVSSSQNDPLFLFTYSHQYLANHSYLAVKEPEIESTLKMHNLFRSNQNNKQNYFSQRITQSDYLLKTPIKKIKFQFQLNIGEFTGKGEINYKFIEKIFQGLGINLPIKSLNSIELGINKQYFGNFSLTQHEECDQIDQAVMFIGNKVENKQNPEIHTVSVFQINFSRNGFVNPINLDFFTSQQNEKFLKDSIIKSKNKSSKSLACLDDSQQKQQIQEKRGQARLRKYLERNSFPVISSSIIFGRKAKRINGDLIENINNQRKYIKSDELNHMTIQIKMQGIRLGSRVLVAKVKDNNVGRLFAFVVSKKTGNTEIRSNKFLESQKNIVFHPEFEEDILWPDLSDMDTPQGSICSNEYLVIFSPELDIPDALLDITKERYQQQKFGKNNDSEGCYLEECFFQYENIFIQNLKEFRSQFLTSIIKVSLRKSVSKIFNSPLFDKTTVGSINDVMRSLNIYIQTQIQHKFIEEKASEFTKSSQTAQLTKFKELLEFVEKTNKKQEDFSQFVPIYKNFREVFSEGDELFERQDLFETCVNQMEILFDELKRIQSVQLNRETIKHHSYQKDQSQLTNQLDFHFSSIYQTEMKIVENFVIFLNELCSKEIQSFKKNLEKSKTQQLQKGKSNYMMTYLQLIKDSMYILNFSFIVQNKGRYSEYLQNIESKLESLKKNAYPQLLKLSFYYFNFPRIIRSINFDCQQCRFISTYSSQSKIFEKSLPKIQFEFLS